MEPENPHAFTLYHDPDWRERTAEGERGSGGARERRSGGDGADDRVVAAIQRV